MPLIELKNVSKIYEMGNNKIGALDGIFFSLDPGEFLAIIGPSGSGKSTLMHIMGLLDTPTSGEILLEGKNINGFSENKLARLRSEKIGFIFQAFNLLPRTSSVGNVMMPILYSANKKKSQERAIAMLKKVGLENRLNNTPNQLSGGQQQRVAIARALINDPQVVFADEPTGNLDSQAGEEIMHILSQLNKEGKTIVLVTHEANIARYARRIIEMKDGKII